jgi:hypothetical protein
MKERKPPVEIPEDATAADLARSISGDIEHIMKKYSRWKDDVDETDEFKDFSIETE